ncbi:MAG: hypothetical protein CMB80_29855 [Flammeovirgaceae bacterium]|nr:hypothetical protein [Flammeovirgaceae bacterium]MBR10217.1 hypothetical protein [Rickettsiales bacterium]HCX23415.1 hypothetical protein [Cytophagales bacterium]
MNTRSVILVLLMLVGVAAVHAQYRAPKSKSYSKSNSNFTDRIYFGGGGGLSGGSQYLNISVSPLVGYKITESFSSGLQLSYQYVRFTNASANNFGGGPFANYVIANKFMIYTQYEYMSYELLNGFGEKFRFNGRSWFAGIGWNSPINDNVSFQVLALYDLIYGTGENSPYSQPWQFRMGIVAGF